MTDIVKRLLAFRPPYGWPEEVSTIIEPPMNKVAANEILLLRAENEKLLERLEKAHSFISRGDCMQLFEEECAAAAALKETGDE